MMAFTVLLSCLAVAACSRIEPQPADPPEKVTIAFATLTETALAQVAKTAGYYREEGLEVTPHLHAYGKLALRDLLEGEAEFATVAETPAMFAILNGEKIAIIASIQSSQKGHAIIARQDKGIRQPQDLKGRKIATTLGTTADFFLDGFLATQGISRKELTVVNLKPEEVEAALVNGAVDATSSFHPFLSNTQKRLGNQALTFYYPELYTMTFNVVATQEFIRRHPDKVRKVLRALVKAETFARENPIEAQTMVAQFTGIPSGVVSEVWANSSFAVTLNQALILVLEDESRWAIENQLSRARTIPNYLDYIYSDGLKSVKPDAVMILH